MRGQHAPRMPVLGEYERLKYGHVVLLGLTIYLAKKNRFCAILELYRACSSQNTFAFYCRKVLIFVHHPFRLILLSTFFNIFVWFANESKRKHSKDCLTTFLFCRIVQSFANSELMRASNLITFLADESFRTMQLLSELDFWASFNVARRLFV